MSIRSVDEWRKIMADLTPSEAADKIVAELDPAARTVYTQVVIGNALAAFAVANGKPLKGIVSGRSKRESHDSHYGKGQDRSRNSAGESRNSPAERV
jgi:hypothetical protein